MAAAMEGGLPRESGTSTATDAPTPPPEIGRKLAGQTMAVPRVEVRLKGGETVRPTRRARERVTGASRTPRLHQFSQSARLQKELLAASQMMPEPEPEPEVALSDPVVSTAQMSLAQARANAKRNPPMKAQTPRLRAKAVAKAAVDSQWPSKNVSATPRYNGRLTERTRDAEEGAELRIGRPAAGKPVELSQRAPPHKIAEILGGLQELSDNTAVQRVLENSIAGHSGLYIPKNKRMVTHWGKAQKLARMLSNSVGAVEAAVSGRRSVHLSDGKEAAHGHYAVETDPSAEQNAQKQAAHMLKQAEHRTSMFTQISERVSTPRTMASTPGIANDEPTGSSGSGRKPAVAPALPALAPAPAKPDVTSATVPEVVRQLRGVLQVHPVTAHKHFTAEHLTTVNRLIVDGMPIKPNTEASPKLTVQASSVFLTSSVPREFETIRAGDVITIVVDGKPVRRRVLAEELPVEDVIMTVPQPPLQEHSKPRMSRTILKAIFEQLDQNRDGVVDERELLHCVATDETLAQLLHLAPASPRHAGTTGSEGDKKRAQVLQDDMASVQAVMTDIAKTHKQSHDAQVKAAVIDLVSPRGGGALNRTRDDLSRDTATGPPSPADSSLGISSALMSVPDRDVLEAMDPDAVRQLALDLGMSPEQVGAAAPPRQVGFEEFAQFLESLVASSGTSQTFPTRARINPRGRPDSPDTLQVDAPFCNEDLSEVTYSVSRHLRPVAEWGLDVDLPSLERPDGITWEAAGVLPPQIRADIAQEELEAGMLLAHLTPRMETVNRNKAGRAAAEKDLQKAAHTVARPPKDQRVYKGPASLRGRRMRAVGSSSGTWKC